MKKLAVSLWISLYPFLLLAQISTVQKTNIQPSNFQFIHELLYQDRTGITAIPSIETVSPMDHHEEMYLFNPDTTWGYDESKWHGSEQFEPGSFSQHFDVGTEMEFVRHGNVYYWEGDTTGWVLNRKNLEWIREAFKDSSKSYDTDENGDPIYGSFYIYSRNPSMGASEESFYHRFDPTLGWVKDSRYLRYDNEDETINWSKNYRYDSDSSEYIISNESMTEDLETHYQYEYKSYAGGLISFWDKRFKLYNDDGTTAYSLIYRYNTTFSRLDPSDSTAYVYHEDYAEALGYKWYTDVWEWDNYTRTYESPSMLSPNGVKIDSVVTFEVFYNAELDSTVTGIRLTKTEYFYDANDNLIEQIYYTQGSNGFEPQSRNTHEYELIDEMYYQMLNRSYRYSYITMDLYLWGEWQNLIDPANGIQGDITYFFTEAGDTTSGFKNVWYQEYENYYSFRYNWDLLLHEFVLSDFMVEAFTEPVSFFAYNSTEYGSDRSMYVIDGLPAAMNPGPLLLAIDDTVDFVVTAFNPDKSTPDVAMSGLPATATFDTETRRFYWIVDEEVAGPFMITASKGELSTTIDVKIVFGEFTVGAENDKELPDKITLHQNYPNPFNPTTTISFELSRPQIVTLQVFNILGQHVQTLISDELLTAGLKELSFNANQLSSGVYYYRLDAGDKVFTKKMTLVK